MDYYFLFYLFLDLFFREKHYSWTNYFFYNKLIQITVSSIVVRLHLWSLKCQIGVQLICPRWKWHVHSCKFLLFCLRNFLVLRIICLRLLGQLVCRTFLRRDGLGRLSLRGRRMGVFFDRSLSGFSSLRNQMLWIMLFWCIDRNGQNFWMMSLKGNELRWMAFSSCCLLSNSCQKWRRRAHCKLMGLSCRLNNFRLFRLCRLPKLSSHGFSMLKRRYIEDAAESWLG